MQQLPLFDDTSEMVTVSAAPLTQRELIYAVDIAGLSTLLDSPLTVMIAPVIPSRKTVVVEKGVAAGGIGAILECDAARAEAIITFVRRIIPKHKLAFYRSKTGAGWERI